MAEELLRRCLENVDQLSVSAGALTWLEHCLDDLIDLQGAQPPFTIEQANTLRLVGEWPTKQPA